MTVVSLLRKRVRDVNINRIIQWYITSDTCPVCRVDQGHDKYIKFRNMVEDNMRDKYKDAINSMEDEIIR